MIPAIYEDTGQKIGKHDNIKLYCRQNGIELIRIKLKVGDYTLPTDQRVCVDTKQGCEELYQDLVSDTERFRREYHLAERLGIQLVILIEDPFIHNLDEFETDWTNPLLKKFQRGKTKTAPRANAIVRKQIDTISRRHGTRFLWCHPADTGEVVVRLLMEGPVEVTQHDEQF